MFTFVLMRAVKCIGLLFPLLSLLLMSNLQAQEPLPPTIAKPPRGNPVYMLNIVPKEEGKTHTLFSKTKVIIQLQSGNEIRGRMSGVTQDSISIDYRSYPVKDILEIRYNPGTTLGAIAAIATTIGVAAVAITVNGGKDKERDQTEDAIFYSGVGLAVAGGITLIPTYFVKKKFTVEKYDFMTVRLGG